MGDEYDVLERLSYLSPNAIDPLHIPGTAPARLTPSDVSAMLRYLSDGARILARYWGGEQDQRKQLVYWLQIQTTDIVSGLNSKKIPLSRLFAELAVKEVVDPRICNWCKGRGKVPETDDGKPTGRVLTCGGCNGGRYAYTERARARECGDIHPEDWKRRYSARYCDVLSIAYGYKDEIVKALLTSGKNPI